MKKSFIVVSAIFFLVLPIIAILAIYFIFAINIFDNPDFWYGYMAYFSTVALAAVSLWQNENANMINQQKIYYFDRRSLLCYSRNCR